MKKKTKKRLKWLLALLIVGAFVSLWTMPQKIHTPKMKWRVPVKIVMPDISDLPPIPKMPNLDGAADTWTDIKDQALAFEEKLMPEEPADAPVVPMVREEAVIAPAPAEPARPVVSPPIFGDRKPRIAIVIDDMGLVAGMSQRAARLPAHVTLSYLPYAPSIQEQVNQAKNKGHDILLHLPMEPMGRANPGPNAMMVGQDEEQWQRIIMNNISAFDGFIGVNNHMGSRFTMDNNGLKIVAEAMHEEGLFFLDSRTNPRSLAESVMRERGVSTASRDVFLDDTQTEAAVRGELARLEAVARRKGSAIAIGHPHAVTLRVLETWLPEAESRGFSFVPVRTLVR